jgi:hypothetical protein
MIHDIINTEGQFLTPLEIEQKYNLKCDIFKYNPLKDAISVEYRNFERQ